MRNPVLADLGGYPLAALQDLKVQRRAEGAELHDFSIGDPIEPTPAFIAQALRDAVPTVSQYPTAAGPAVLRQTIADWVARRFGVAVDAEREVLPTAGSKEAIFHLPLGLLDPRGPRRAVLWGDPGYPVYGRGQRFAGGTSDPVTLTADADWRLNLDRLPPGRLRGANLAWINYPHNPTGAAVDRAWLGRQLRTARDAGLVLASDECYVDVYPPGAPPPPSLLQAAALPQTGDGAGDGAGDGTGDGTGAGRPVRPDLTGLVVAFSLSKRSGMTGYRSGALVGDPALIADQRLLRPNIGTASPEFVQAAAVAAWSEDGHAADRREVFAAKRAVLLDFLDAAGFTVSGSDATFYLWVAAPGGDDARYAGALLTHDIVVSPGRAFGAGGRGWLRLALVPSLEGCAAAVARWRAGMEAGTLPGHG